MKLLKGKVISKKMQKTATVVVTRVAIHKIYKKRYKVTKKYHVHDELDTKVGDMVIFVSSKPYSKLKKWKIIDIENTKAKRRKTRNHTKSKKDHSKSKEKAVKK